MGLARYVINGVPVIAPLCALFALAGCQVKRPTTGPANVVRGTATYINKIAIPDDSWLSVRLVDLGGTGSGRIISAKRYEKPGQVPIHFELPFNAGAIDPGRKYAIEASIGYASREWFRTAKPAPVFTERGHDTVELVLKMR